MSNHLILGFFIGVFATAGYLLYRSIKKTQRPMKVTEHLHFTEIRISE